MALYVALCYYDRDRYWDEPPETEFSPEYTEFARRATEAGVMRGGEALHPVTMSTTITVSGGRGGDVMLTDGPYAEAKEVLAGYFVLETADLDEAIGWAVQIPAAGGARSNSARSRHTTPRRPPMDASAALVKVLREEGPRVLATLVRYLGDLPVAEDALSETTIAALEAWPASGIPDNPRAWLTVVARRKALDLLRRESARAGKETAAYRWGTERAKDEIEEVIDAMETESQLRDDMLRLIFTCCHPALSREAQVALALRTLARLEVDAIARAFLVPEATMAKRLVRARSKIATARIPYVIPSDAELPDRLAAVLAVVYLIATEAHAPTGGDSVARVDLEAEAVRLARLLVELMPDEPEVLSLLALLLFTSARTPARSDAEGHVVTLANQDRDRWNREAIAEGSRWLQRAVSWSGGKAGPYQLQAHLAAAHSTATSWAETDWDRIIELYDLLGSVAANPVVALNRAVAITERDGPQYGLAALGAIVGMERSHLWHAALADNLRRLGRTAEAAEELETAAALAPAEGERRLLLSRLLDVRSEPA